MNLYTTSAKKFSDTRQFPWAGWKTFSEQDYFKNLTSKSISILDLGCGNGRFLKFLLDSNIKISKYLGLDSSKELIDIAKQTFASNENHEFRIEDLDIEDWGSKVEEFDLIVAFGLTHHLKNNQSRQNLIDKSLNLLNDSGLLIFTIWKFKENKKFMEKHLVKDLGKDDFILSFANDSERFCHFSNEKEVESLTKNLKIVDSFRSDGFGNEMNEYFVVQK